MRPIDRLALLALPALVLGCAEAGPAGPGGPGIGSLAIHAVAPPSLVRFGPNLAVEQVRVRLYRVVGDISRDVVQRVVPFNVNSTTLNVSLSFVTAVAAETLSVQLDYETQTGTVLFSAFQSVEVRAGVPASTPPLQPGYVGPGSNVAFLSLSPLDTTLTAGDSLVFAVSALDGQQAPVPSFYVSWSTDDAQLPVNANGVLRTTTGTSTVLTVTAQTPNGTSASTSVTILGPQALVITPDSVEKLPGGTQQFSVTGPAGPYTWSVNGTDGGNTTFGTVDPNGFYQAPATVPTPSSFQICARVTATPSTAGCGKIVISPIPSAGADVLVFNDINIWDNSAFVTGGGGDSVNNDRLVRNIVGFTAQGSRANGTVLMNYHGSGSICGSSCASTSNTTMTAILAAAGFSVIDELGPTLDSIPAGVKVLFLWTPSVVFSRNEINLMKQFAAQGGRLVFVGEHDGYYAAGIPIENQFLIDMGAQMTNIGQAVDCGRVVQPDSVLRQHQVTTGMTAVAMGCASVIVPGPNDFPLWYDMTNTQVLAAVAKVSLVPLPAPPAAIRRPALPPAPVRPAADPLGRPWRSRD